MIYFSAALFFIGLVLIVWAFFKDSVRRIRRRNRDNEPIAFASVLMDSEYTRGLGNLAHGITEDAGIHANQVAGRYADNKILKKEGNTNGLHKS